MPVEVRELVIRVVTNSESEDHQNAGVTQRSIDMNALVQECIRQIMIILRRREER